MNLSQYGPFANVVAVACALVATFSLLILKTFGSVNRWTWLASGAPSFLVTAAARVLAVALMAVTYVTINKWNYGWFAALAVLFGVAGFIAIVRFESLRQRHVVSIPLVGADGQPFLDHNNRALQQNVVVGVESNMRDDAKAALVAARKKTPGLSVRQFMSGFGPQRVNDPEALWDPTLLADTRSRLTITLMSVVLLGVMTLFLAAFSIEAFNR